MIGPSGDEEPRKGGWVAVGNAETMAKKKNCFKKHEWRFETFYFCYGNSAFVSFRSFTLTVTFLAAALT